MISKVRRISAFQCFAIMLLVVTITSCSGEGKLSKYRIDNRDPEQGTYVVLTNGDTLKGKKLKVPEKKDWSLDGKPIDPLRVVSFQDHDGIFRTFPGELKMQPNLMYRILRGKVSLWWATTTIPGPVVFNPYKDKTTYYSSMYMLFADGSGEWVTYNSLTNLVQDCKPALKMLEDQFRGSAMVRHPDWKTKYYKPTIRVLEIYNNQCAK